MVQYRSVYVDVDQKRTEGFFPARVIDTDTFGWRDLRGGINVIENEENGFELGMGYSPEQWSNFPLSFNFGKYIQDYPSTLREGGSRSNPADYGQNEWTANFLGDIAFFGDNITGYSLVIINLLILVLIIMLYMIMFIILKGMRR